MGSDHDRLLKNRKKNHERKICGTQLMSVIEICFLAFKQRIRMLVLFTRAVSFTSSFTAKIVHFKKEIKTFTLFSIKNM